MLSIETRPVIGFWPDRPIRIERRTASYNAAETVTILVTVALPLALLVWNPFVTSFATEAGKDAYSLSKKWITKLFAKVAELRDLILHLRAFYGETHIDFIVRRRNPAKLSNAVETLDGAARQAMSLIQKLRQADRRPKSLTYEYDHDSNLWFPVFADLYDGGSSPIPQFSLRLKNYQRV